MHHFRHQPGYFNCALICVVLMTLLSSCIFKGEFIKKRYSRGYTLFKPKHRDQQVTVYNPCAPVNIVNNKAPDKIRTLEQPVYTREKTLTPGLTKKVKPATNETTAADPRSLYESRVADLPAITLVKERHRLRNERPIAKSWPGDGPGLIHDLNTVYIIFSIIVGCIALFWFMYTFHVGVGLAIILLGVLLLSIGLSLLMHNYSPMRRDR